MTFATHQQFASETSPMVAQDVLAPPGLSTSGPTLQLAKLSPEDPLPTEIAERVSIVFAAGQIAECATVCAKLLNSYPTSGLLWSTLGLCHLSRKALNEALTCLNRASELAPHMSAPHIGMADVYTKLGQEGTAEGHFQTALTLETDNISALNNYANFLSERGRTEEAVPLLQKACGLAPDNAILHYNLANAQRHLGDRAEAKALYERALDLNPDLHEARYNYGQLLCLDQDYEAAGFQFDQLLSVDAKDDRARAQKLHVMAMLNDFAWVDDYEKHRRHLGLQGSAVAPFATLGLEDNPDLLRVRTQAYAQTIFPPQTDAMRAFPRPAARPKRLKIGYFSADFHNHATMHLLSGLLRTHDTERFEIHAFSYGPERADRQRELVKAHVAQFHEAQALSDKALIDLALAQELDIAIDLKGYTGNTRTAIFGHRLAPVQISYLGYPGTLGTPIMDYLITDSVVSPAGSERYYDEHLIRLPHSYQPNDNKRRIAPRQFTRADCGLPEEGFIFCCFNNSYKITPREFGIWMRLLNAVEGSVLWLLSGGPTAEANLRREAEARGISADRLIFAERMPQDEHLARQKVADLFLDTFAVNAHTTCSDALWAGLPVLTLPGRQFAARVGASLLTAVNLPDLIAKDEADYEARALHLATDPDALMALRGALMVNRRTAPLFDTVAYTAALEGALDAAHEAWRLGQPRTHLTVAPTVLRHSAKHRGRRAVAAA